MQNFDGAVSYGARIALSGRLGCSIYLSSKEFIRSKSYSMVELCRSQLGLERRVYDDVSLRAAFNSCDSLTALVEQNCNDAFLIFSLMFKLSVIPLTKQITNLPGGKSINNDRLSLAIAGNVW